MATIEELLAAAQRADDAGNTDDARALVDAAREMMRQAQTVPSVPADAGPNTLQGAELQALTPPRADAPKSAPTPSQDQWLDTTSDMMQPGIASTKQFAGGLADQSQSPSLRYLQGNNVPAWLQRPLAAAGDLGGMTLSALGTGMAGAAGLVSEVIPQSPTRERQLANDLLSASQFAIPELAGSSSIIRAGRNALAPEAPTAAPVTSKTIAAMPETAVTETVVASDQAIANTIGQAAKASRAPAGKDAAKIAADAAPDAATIAAAEKLGFDLPADVFATNDLIRRAAGGARGIVGSADEANWLSTVVKAANTADTAIRKMASADLSEISENVSNALNVSQAQLKAQAKQLYREVEAAVPKQTKISTPKAVAVLEARAADLGGVGKLSTAERAMLNMLKAEGGMTYEWVKTMRSKLGREAFGVEDAFPNLDKAQKRMLTATLGEDMLAAAETYGGQAARDALKAANRLTALQKGLETRITAAFGRDGYGSIANKLRGAITSGGRGDVAGLNRILNIIPDDLRKDAIGAAISELSRAKGGIAKGAMTASDTGGFGFAEFANLYRNLRRNSAVYKTVTDTIGDEGKALMDDLFRVSRAITDARANVSTTGKANQWLDAVPRGITTRVLESSAGQKTVQGLAGGAGAIFGGPIGAAVATPIAIALTKAAPETLAAAGKLFRSPEFMILIKAEAAGKPAAAIEILKKSKPFQQFLKASGQTAEEFFANGNAGRTAAPAAQMQSAR